MANASPIADLSYRGYEGELMPARNRWWVIARMGIRLAFKRKAYWVVTALSGWYYLVMMAILFFFDQAAQSSPRAAPGFEAFLTRIVWKDQLMHGFSFSQLLCFVVAMMLGAGAIANDNRANALLVYLSKPCDKKDYLIGKWVGLFLPILIMMAIPPLVFYLYGAFSYRSYGFLSNDPWMGLRFLLVLPIAAGVHASLILGVSSLFNHGRMAGATYAGIYFLTNFFTQLMSGVWMAMQMAPKNDQPPSALAQNVDSLYYFSIDGALIGVCKAILGTDGSPVFATPSPLKSVPAPGLLPFLAGLVVLSAFALWVAWRRIQAVEVVR